MRIGKLILRMRQKQANLQSRGLQATFGNFVGGSIELSQAQLIPAQRDLCFIVPVGASAEPSTYEGGVDQLLYERFSALVCLKVDTQLNDDYGIVVYDRLHDIRDEIMSAFLGWRLAESEDVITYKGESLIDYNNAYLWYQFEFEYPARVLSRTIFDTSGLAVDGTGSADYVDGGIEVNDIQDVNIEGIRDFNKLYSQVKLMPNDDVPLESGLDLPLQDNFPDVKIPNIGLWVEKEV